MIRHLSSGILLACLLAACGPAETAPGNGKPDGSGFDPTCEGRADDYFAGMKKTSTNGGVTVEIVSADPAPPANSDMNAWTLKLSGDGGAPFEGATIVGSPFMIDHGHGAPNQIASELTGGRYKLGPLALKMAGLWQVTLKITPPGGQEISVVFSFCIPPA